MRELGLSWNADKFLSTLPARGATRSCISRVRPYTISIHAPREGSDSFVLILLTFHPIFLSTLPARGATIVCNSMEDNLILISIHAPREGSDVGGRIGCLPLVISIHAPREGSDCSSLPTTRRWWNFYPRSPRGERHPRHLHRGE